MWYQGANNIIFIAASSMLVMMAIARWGVSKWQVARLDDEQMSETWIREQQHRSGKC